MNIDFLKAKRSTDVLSYLELTALTLIIKMVIKNQLLDMSPLGMRFTVLKTAGNTQGKSLDLHWELLPGCNMKDPLVHTHPHAVETYEILEGEMEFYIDNKWIPATKGEKLSVQMGQSHAFRNPTQKMATVYNTHQPALKMENYFEDICKVLDKLTDNRQKQFKMNARAMLYMGILMNNYREEIIAQRPPDMAIKVLGCMGKVLNLHY